MDVEKKIFFKIKIKLNSMDVEIRKINHPLNFQFNAFFFFLNFDKVS